MSKAWALITVGLAGLVLVQELRVRDLQVDVAKAEAAEADAGQKRAQQSQAATEKNASAYLGHADTTKDNIYDYTQTIKALEAGRAADAGRIAGLQHSLRATATAHAQAASDLDACRNLADRHQQLADLAARGAGVVAAGVDLVKQRDAEVTLLKSQLHAERALIQQLNSP